MKIAFLCFATAAVTAAAVMTGCGSGNEPLGALGSPNTSFENSLSLPYASSNGATVIPTNYQPFVTSTAGLDGIEFNTNVGASYNVIAPAAGLVTATDANSVSITNNIHISSRLTKMSTVTVRVGDFVQAGSLLGTSSVTNSVNTPLVHLSVLVDGVAVCPYGFFVDTVKSLVNNLGRTVASSGPCNP